MSCFITVSRHQIRLIIGYSSLSSNSATAAWYSLQKGGGADKQNTEANRGRSIRLYIGAWESLYVGAWESWGKWTQFRMELASISSFYFNFALLGIWALKISCELPPGDKEEKQN